MKIKKHHYNCPLCGRDIFKKIYGVSVFDICVCQVCGVVCLNPRMREEERMEGFIKEYDSNRFGDFLVPPVDVNKPYYNIEMWSNRAYNDIRPHIDQDSEILEIGFGQGENLVAIKINGHDNLTGIEPYRNCCERLQNFYDIDCKAKSLSEFETDKKFDCIILDHVLEQFTEPVKAIKKIKAMLKENGILYIRTPDLYKWNYPFFSFCVPHNFYYTHATLKVLLWGNKLETEWLEGRTGINEIVIIANKDNNIFDFNIVSRKYIKRANIFLKENKFLYPILISKRFIEEVVIKIFGESVYLSIRNFLKKIAIKIIRIFK